MNATAESIATAQKAVHFVLQGKGGVGKSLVAALLAQYVRGARGSVRCIDTDPINQTLMNYKGLGVQHIPLMDGPRIDERRFDRLMESLLTEDGIFVVDNGASSFVPMSNYLVENNALSMLQDAGREVYIHCVVTGGQALLDTVSGFNALAKKAPEDSMIVWLNEFFGEIQDGGKNFDDMKAYRENISKVRGLIRIAKRNHDTFGRDIEEMARMNMTFDEVFTQPTFAIMSRQRIRTVQREIYSQLSAIKL